MNASTPGPPPFPKQAPAQLPAQLLLPARYTGTAIALHWLIALLLLGQFAFGLMLEDIPRGTPERGYYLSLHKSSGIVIGLLILLRLGWRLAHKPPPLPASTPSWQRRAARVSHIALYVCMLALPLSGYLASNFSKHGVKFFNLVRWAPWGPDDKPLYAFLNGAHHLFALLLAVLVAIHVFAVAKHMLVDRDRLLLRMLPCRRKQHGARDIDTPFNPPVEIR